jgi:hypothetical protein
MFAIVADEVADNPVADLGRGFLLKRERDGEAEEAMREELSATYEWKKENSPKEETS